MAFKLTDAAQQRWRAINAPHLVALVRAGTRFECGKLVERDPVLQATQTADDTPVQSPTASNQPVTTPRNNLHPQVLTIARTADGCQPASERRMSTCGAESLSATGGALGSAILSDRLLPGHFIVYEEVLT